MTKNFIHNSKNKRHNDAEENLCTQMYPAVMHNVVYPYWTGPNANAKPHHIIYMKYCKHNSRNKIAPIATKFHSQSLPPIAQTPKRLNNVTQDKCSTLLTLFWQFMILSRIPELEICNLDSFNYSYEELFSVGICHFRRNITVRKQVRFAAITKNFGDGSHDLSDDLYCPHFMLNTSKTSKYVTSYNSQFL